MVYLNLPVWAGLAPYLYQAGKLFSTSKFSMVDLSKVPARHVDVGDVLVTKRNLGQQVFV